MKDRRIRYMVIGAGGTGGAIGSHLANAGHNVTFIARGRHLQVMESSGLHVRKPNDSFLVKDFRAYTEEEFLEAIQDKDKGSLLLPDVILVCVKGYSIDDIIPFVKKAASNGAVVIPILNLFNTGRYMQERLPGITVTDGCIYVASMIESPGVILMNGEILRVVFGLRREDADRLPEYKELFSRIYDDMTDSGIDCIVSDNIERDALRKFSYVSPQGACGLYYGIPCGPMQHPGEERDLFAGLVHEVQLLAEAMGIDFGEDIVPTNLKILDGLAPDMNTSLQRDMAAGRPSEIVGLIYEVLRLADEYGIDLPLYKKVVDKLKGTDD